MIYTFDMDTSGGSILPPMQKLLPLYINLQVSYLLTLFNLPKPIFSSPEALHAKSCPRISRSFIEMRHVFNRLTKKYLFMPQDAFIQAQRGSL